MLLTVLGCQGALSAGTNVQRHQPRPEHVMVFMLALCSAQGDFVHSNGPDTRSHFIDLFGPELAEYLLALIERDNNVP